MKNGILNPLLIASLAVSLSALQGSAEDIPATASPDASVTVTVTTNTTESVKLPYGVEDVLKLSRAQVSDDVITTYIQNTGTIYNLEPKDIVYLKEQGVSDRIVNTMMDQRRIANEVAAQARQQQAAAQQPAVIADNSNPITTRAYSEPEPVSPAVTQPAASSLYVIPYPTPAYPYYSRSYSYPYSYPYPYYSSSYPYCYSYPYSYSYYGYSRPVVGFRFGVGGHAFHASRSYHHR
jgi:hypothetical protein